MAKNDQKNVDALAKYLKYGFIAFCLLVVGVIAYAIFYMANSGNYVASLYDVKAKKTVAKIPKEDFSYLFNQVKQQIYANYGTEVDFSTYAESARITALEAAKDVEVQLIKAKEMGIGLSEKGKKRADELYDNYVNAFGDLSKSEVEEQTKQVLGINLKQLKRIYTKLAHVNLLIDKEKENKAEWDKKVKDYYDNNPGAFKSSQFRKSGEEAVWVRHILIKTVDEQNNQLTAEEVKKAEKKANDLLSKAKGGEDFIKLVAENSEDFGSAATGGDYIFAKGSGMDAAFEKGSFDLKAGEFGIVKSTFGYHVIKKEESIPQGQPVSFKAASQYREYRIDDMVFQEIVNEWGKNIDVKKNNQVYSEFQ